MYLLLPKLLKYTAIGLLLIGIILAILIGIFIIINIVESKVLNLFLIIAPIFIILGLIFFLWSYLFKKSYN